jgi:hypothetical protein
MGTTCMIFFDDVWLGTRAVYQQLWFGNSTLPALCPCCDLQAAATITVIATPPRPSHPARTREETDCVRPSSFRSL